MTNLNIYTRWNYPNGSDRNDSLKTLSRKAKHRKQCKSSHQCLFKMKLFHLKQPIQDTMTCLHIYFEHTLSATTGKTVVQISYSQTIPWPGQKFQEKQQWKSKHHSYCAIKNRENTQSMHDKKEKTNTMIQKFE